MQNYNIYRAKGNDSGLEFIFKYDLHGHLKGFEIVEGELNEKQKNWLFNPQNFPVTETDIKATWIRGRLRTKFDVTVAPAVLTFDAVWELFEHKIKKFESEHAWSKCSEATKIKIFASIPEYKKYINRKGIAQKNLASYILKRYYEDDWKRAE
ncbi:MAG: hypothetical protein JST78_09665 [Bacteroidetes bacterium]|nr:hypothetical protein [Bacteroidota bacterium]